MCKADAIDLLFGCTIYNSISATIVQLKQSEVMPIDVNNQNTIGFELRVIKTDTNKIGTASKLPNAHNIGSLKPRYDLSLNKNCVLIFQIFKKN